MGSKERDGTWAKIPSFIYKNLDVISPSEQCVLGYMALKLYNEGNPTNSEFSKAHLSQWTGLSGVTVIDVIASLVRKKLIFEVGTGSRGVKKYAINHEWDRSLLSKAEDYNNL